MFIREICKRFSSLKSSQLLLLVLLLALIICADFADAGRKRDRNRRRNKHNPKLENPRKRADTRKHEGRSRSRGHRNIHNSPEYPFNIVESGHGKHRTGVRTDVIKSDMLSESAIRRLINAPMTYDFDHTQWQRTVRRQRLYCRGANNMGYRLEIDKQGRVKATLNETDDGILEIYSVANSVVGIRSWTRKYYLCMNARGKVYTRKKTHGDCQFRETYESNNYNTYASERYSNHKLRKGYYLAISKKGKVKRGKKFSSYKHRNAQWLALNVRTPTQ
ncbi:unnamed protein product [Clavelina lepadiformis]|uniref:Fibroblast growth factor n=1 Tax=Clavelina lepadiformis TaxID=159417 RepID=A0ABP0FHV7_CLALP